MKTLTKKFIASIAFLLAVLVLMAGVMSSFPQQANALMEVPRRLHYEGSTEG